MNIQKELENLGSYGCYLLCLLRLGYVEDQCLRYYRLFKQNNWIDDECTILKPCDILKCITGNNYRVVKSDKPDEKADIVVQYWYNPKAGLHHFTLPNWDPLGESNTRLNGHIESYRLFYKI